MKFIFTLLGLLCLNNLFGRTHNDKLLIRNVNVISMSSATEYVDKEMDVYIEKGKIVSILPAGKRPHTNTNVIDGTGKYLIPGLADMHVHMPRSYSDFNTRDFLLMQLANGVTTMRQMRGLPQDLNTRDSIKKGYLLGGDMYISTPYFKNRKDFDATAIEDSLLMYKKMGFDFIKYLYGMNEGQYDTFNNLARKNGFMISGHAATNNLAFAVKEGEHVEHIDPFVAAYKKDSVQFWKTIDEMAAKHLFTCPDVFWYNTVGLYVTIDKKMQYTGMQYLPDSIKQRLRKEMEERALKYFRADPNQLAKYIQSDSTNVAIYEYLLPKLYAKGVPLLISPGDGELIIPGFSYLEELKIFVASGLSPYKTLRCATYNAADFFNATDKWGTVTVNSDANLLLLNANPLDDINNLTNSAAIILHGKVLHKDELMQMAGR